jgi:hypothetical protein
VRVAASGSGSIWGVSDARAVSHTVTQQVPVPVERLFDTVVAEDVLPYVLHRHMLVPGVRSTDELSGPWDVPGSTRLVRLTNGATVREEVTGWQRPNTFSYRVTSLPKPLSLLADEAVGLWGFEAVDDARCRLIWTYSFQPKGGWAIPLLRAFMRTQWAGYMRRCAERCGYLAMAGRPS